MSANVAYDGTHTDLGMGSGAQYLNTSADPSLFGFDDMFSFSASSEAAATSSTISPKDLLMENMNSVPSSTAFPDLTPGSEMLATPDTSPWIATYDSFATNDSEDWAFPLFSDVHNDDAEDLSASTPALKRNDLSASQLVIVAASESRKDSTASPSPVVSGLKALSSAGIRKRQKPLPAIVVNAADPIALKRARNTAAARKSRERKEAHRDSLEFRIAELEALLKQRDDEIASLKAQSSPKDPYGLSDLTSFDAL